MGISDNSTGVLAVPWAEVTGSLYACNVQSLDANMFDMGCNLEQGNTPKLHQ